MLTLGKQTSNAKFLPVLWAGPVEARAMSKKQKPGLIEVDSQWFTDRLAERRLSLRGLAKLMEMSPSSLSLRLSGRYKITMEEATVLSQLLGVPFEEIVLRSGIKIPKDATKSVRLIGQVAGVTVKKLGASGAGTVPRPVALPADTVAIRGVEPGWFYFFTPSQKLQPEAVGRLAVVEGGPPEGGAGGAKGTKGGPLSAKTGQKAPQGGSQTWLGVLERGSRGGVWNVRGVFGGGVEGVRVVTATPVLMILP